MIHRIGFVLALLFLAASPAAAAPAPGAELKALRAKLEALKHDIARDEGSRSEAADALKSSEQSISDANRRLAELSASRSALDARLQELDRQRATVSARLTEQQALAAKLIQRQYIAGDSGPLRLLAGGLDPNRTARDRVYLGYVAEARKAILDGLRSDADALRGLIEESAQRRQELAANHDEQVAQRRVLDEQRRSHRQVMTKIAAQIQRQRQEVGALERDERRLAKLVEDLAKMLAARKARPRSPTQERPGPSTDGSAFGQLKGRLQAPVRGELIGRFGSPRSDSGLSWRGLFIQAPAGREVKAVAAGRVVFADWLRGFGNLLILDHGDGFMSLYGNNETLLGQTGDPVRGGDTVATVGSSGGNTATGLYFELRHQGKPFDPLGWIDLK